uniref:Uncharacterized protein n=1 Tax=Moniliophthora roreri TaxID=221103 RepID=A0A0W0FXA7_MONRR
MSLKTLCQLGCDHAFFRITQSGPEIIFPSSSNHISSSYQLHPLEPVLCERIGAIGRSTVAGVISDTHSEALKTGSPEVEVMEGASYSKRKLPDAAASKEATLSQPTKKQRTSVSSVTPIRRSARLRLQSTGRQGRADVPAPGPSRSTKYTPPQEHLSVNEYVESREHCYSLQGNVVQSVQFGTKTTIWSIQTLIPNH